jgi:hypothetical protein
MSEEKHDNLYPCPCCGSIVFATKGDYEVCDVCGWEDDPVQSTDPDYAGGANETSLNQARKHWESRQSRE